MQSMSRAVLLATVASSLAACSTVSSGPGAIVSKPDDVPAAIAAPSGAKLAMTLKGSGLQNYECRAKAGVAGGYDWAFVSPEAVLRDKSDAIVGKHYAGPTWEFGDGSRVTGKAIADVPSPQAGNVPWLLLKGTAASGPHALDGVTYVQRTNTSGGTAPSDPCTAATSGMKKSTRYTADYVFFKG